MSELKLNPIVKEETTKERVYRQVKEAILNGNISPDVIFTEVQLAEQLNTSRTPVRETVQDLLKEGLIVSIPRKGLQVKKITSIEQEQISLLRTAIETNIIRKMTNKITGEQLDSLKKLYQKQMRAKEKNDHLTFIELDQQFHAFPLKVLNYTLAEEIILNLNELTRLVGLQALGKYGRMNEVLEEHEVIIRAIEKRDGELAADAMKIHLENTNETLEEIQRKEKESSND